MRRLREQDEAVKRHVVELAPIATAENSKSLLTARIKFAENEREAARETHNRESVCGGGTTRLLH